MSGWYGETMTGWSLAYFRDPNNGSGIIRIGYDAGKGEETEWIRLYPTDEFLREFAEEIIRDLDMRDVIAKGEK